MTPEEIRSIRSVSNQLSEVQRELLASALAQYLGPVARAEIVETLRAQADKLERLDD